MSPSAVPASDGQTYLLVATSGLEMAIPVANVDRVLPAPERLDAMPRIDAKVEGVMGLEGVPLPVTSIARWSGAAGLTPSLSSSVCVLACGTRRLGLLIDRPLRTIRAPTSAVTRVVHEATAGEIFDRVLTESDIRWPILDADRLMDVSNAWASASASRQPVVDGGAVERGGTRRAVVFRSGGHHFAVPVERVLAAAPIAAVQALGVARGLLGAVSWRGTTTALISPLPDDSSGRMVDGGLILLVRGSRTSASGREESKLAIAIDGLDRIHPVTRDGALAAGEVRDSGAGPWPRALLGDGRVVALLDVDLLASAFALQWDPLDARTASAEASSAGKGRGVEGYLVFERGVAWAVELSKVQEVLRLPPAFLDRDASYPLEVSWRERLLPVVDMIEAAGTRLAATGEERLLVILGDNGCFALFADSVQHLLTGRAAERSRIGLPRVGVVEVVTASAGGVQQTFRVMDMTTGAALPGGLPRDEAFDVRRQLAVHKC